MPRVGDQRHAGQQVGLQFSQVGHDTCGVVGDGTPAVAVQVYDEQDAAGRDVPGIGGSRPAIPAHPQPGCILC